MDCLFCRIISGEIPSAKVYEDDRVLLFEDIEPQAPTHLLAIPKEHIDSAAEVTRDNSAIIAYLFEVMARIAKERGLEKGYRIVNNCGEHGQQSVRHLHFHLLGGRQLAWPPG